VDAGSGAADSTDKLSVGAVGRLFIEGRPMKSRPWPGGLPRWQSILDTVRDQASSIHFGLGSRDRDSSTKYSPASRARAAHGHQRAMGQEAEAKVDASRRKTTTTRPT